MAPHNGSFYTLTVSDDEAPLRIDIFLAQRLSDYSRSYFKKLFADGHIIVNDKPVTKSGLILKEGDIVSLTIPKPMPLVGRPVPDTLTIPIIFEHPDFLIINKPAGLNVHAAPSVKEDYTLVDWLIQQFKELKNVGEHDRPGIVHRLDKNTSGLMIIPRNTKAHMIFGDKFRNREIQKTYWALVKGYPDKSGTIDFPIDRDPIHRTRMTHGSTGPNARQAHTEYETLSYFDDHGDDYALVQALPKTGRTHQIRVHMNAIGHPIIGDHLYHVASKKINRQALHAKGLAFEYEGKAYTFSVNLPEDMQKLLTAPQVSPLE
ncbi:MAG: RluA family pseudouridine synthase [Candidatus Babeliales bacterium]